MAGQPTKPDRLGTFSDAVFAVIITILVLELKPPDAHTFSALLQLWPVGLSYAVSYIFIAIVWVNHHHLLGHAEVVTPRLVWSNFAHLFSVSLQMRSFVTMAVFAAAVLVALKWPVVAMTLICLCLVCYLRPDVPAIKEAA